MIHPLQQLAADPNLDANFRRILAGKEPVVTPAISQHAMQELWRAVAAIEGAIAMLGNTTDPHATAAATILKGALRK